MKATWTSIACAVGLALTGPGCGQTGAQDGEPTSAAVEAGATLAAITVEGPREGVIYRYLDPESSTVKTAASVDAVPAAARAQVVVFDTESPPPPGWDHLADVSGGFPITTTPTQGFSYAIRTGAPSTGAAAAQAPKAAREVVMFSTRHCGYCGKARSFFKRNRVPYTEMDLERDSKARSRLQTMGRAAGMASNQLQGVPIIFVDGKVVMGWDERRVRKLLRI